MKFDKRIVDYINSQFHVADILSTERGDDIPDTDFSVSCVAHSDKDPSMRVYSAPGRHAYCFSCGETYTPYRILKIITGFDFTEIVEYLEQNYDMVLPDSLDGEEKDIHSNKEVAQRIRFLKKYNNPKLLNLIQRSLYVDSKSGGTEQIKKLYNRVMEVKESGQI